MPPPRASRRGSSPVARLVATLRIDMSPAQPMFRMAESLAEALQTAQFDEPLELASSEAGLSYNDKVIAALSVGEPIDFVLPIYARPTPYLPLFCVEVCRRVPGIKVHWEGGWPRFHASDGDDEPEDDPLPTTPERLPTHA